MIQLENLESLYVQISFGILIAAVCSLLGMAMVKIGRLRDALDDEKQRTEFFQKYMSSDRRISFWMWPDGSIECQPALVSLLGLKTVPSVFAEISSAFPRHIAEKIIHYAEGEGDDQFSTQVQRGDEFVHVTVEIFTIDNAEKGWPDKIIWLEEFSHESAANIAYGSGRSLFARLSHTLSVIDNIPFPIWQVEADGRLSHGNLAFVKMSGETSFQDISKKGTQIFDLSRQKHMAEKVQRLLASGKKMSEHHFEIVSGARRAYSLSYVPLREEQAIICVARDITNEEEVRAELSRVIDSHQETLNRLQSPVAIFGPDQGIKYWNRAFSILSEISDERLRNDMSHGELLEEMRAKRRLPEHVDFNRWKKQILEYYTELLEPIEEMWHTPDGAIYRVLTQPHHLGGLLMLFEDATDKLALEQSYNTLIAVQNETLDKLHEAVAVFGMDNCLQIYNEGLKDVWNCAATPLKGQHLSEFITQIDAISDQREDNKFAQNIQDWVNGREIKSGKWYRSDRRIFDFSVVPLPDGAVLITHLEVTDSVRIERALRDRSKALEDAGRLKTEFIQNISYEFRTPLNTISGYGEILQQGIFGALEGRQQDAVSNMMDATSELNELISNVLGLAVIQSGDLELDYNQIDLTEILEHVQAVVSPMLKNHDSDLMVLKGDAPVFAADRTQLQQAFVSGVLAVLRLYAGPATIEVGAATTGDEVEIWYGLQQKDNGIFISERQVETFNSGENLSLRGSSGFDLALARSIMTIHKGKLQMVMDDDKFALVFTLPCLKSHDLEQDGI